MKKKIAFALLMGVVTSGIISCVLISINVGFVSNFLMIWLKSWAIAYCIAIPAVLIIAPQIQKFVDKVFDEKK